MGNYRNTIIGHPFTKRLAKGRAIAAVADMYSEGESFGRA